MGTARVSSLRRTALRFATFVAGIGIAASAVAAPVAADAATVSGKQTSSSSFTTQNLGHPVRSGADWWWP